jgi:hypothetical protein
MAIEKTVASASIAEVVDRILDKGVVIDAFIRISLVGIELISIEVRAVVASVETWLKYAEAVGLTVDPAAAWRQAILPIGAEAARIRAQRILPLKADWYRPWSGRGSVHLTLRRFQWRIGVNHHPVGIYQVNFRDTDKAQNVPQKAGCKIHIRSSLPATRGRNNNGPLALQ